MLETLPTLLAGRQMLLCSEGCCPLCWVQLPTLQDATLWVVALGKELQNAGRPAGLDTVRAHATGAARTHVLLTW